MTTKQKKALFRAADKVLDFILWAGLLLFAGLSVSGLLGGCAPVAQDAPPQWPPVVEFESASVEGKLELATPAGPVSVDLESGIVEGGGGDVQVTSASVSADVRYRINGTEQSIRIESPGSRTLDQWSQCVSADVRAELTPGLAVEVHAVPPGLPESCGPAVLEVNTPLGKWVAAGDGGAEDAPSANVPPPGGL